jgi:hypothetical protein
MIVTVHDKSCTLKGTNVFRQVADGLAILQGLVYECNIRPAYSYRPRSKFEIWDLAEDMRESGSLDNDVELQI